MNVRDILSKNRIPNYTLANLAEVSEQDISTYLRQGPISGRRIIQIERAAADLEYVFERLEEMGKETGIYLTVRTKDVESIRNFIQWLKDNPQPNEVANV